MSGDGYGSSQLYYETQCLEDGCYRFTITDSYGDGILGEGYYKVSVDGVVIGSGGGEGDDFSDRDSIDFCIPIPE